MSELSITSVEDEAGKVYFRVNAQKGKEIISKVVDYDSLCKILSISLKREPIKVTVGEVPEGYLDAKISSNGKGEVMVYVPEQIRIFQFDAGLKLPKAYKIPFPACVFRITFGNDVASGYCYPVKGSYEEVKKAYFCGGLKTYNYPFGNIDFQGHICMGNMRINVPEMKDVGLFLDAFFNGVTNNDYRGNEPVTKSGLTQVKFLEFLQGKKKFPYKLLKERGLVSRL